MKTPERETSGMGPATEHRSADWLTAYALGVAFSVPDDVAACAEILEVTSDPTDLLRARARLGGAHVTDPATQTRASRLLNRAVTLTDDRATNDDRAPKVTG
jgi:hypothetical protein